MISTASMQEKKGKVIDSFGSKRFQGEKQGKECTQERPKKKKDTEEKSKCLAKREEIDLYGEKSRQDLAIIFKQGREQSTLTLPQCLSLSAGREMVMVSIVTEKVKLKSIIAEQQNPFWSS